MRQNQGGRAYLVPSTLGIGLIEGYNRMGFEKSLSKPFLRAEVSIIHLAVSPQLTFDPDRAANGKDMYRGAD